MQDILFVLFAAWTLSTAAMVVCCRRPVYAALGLGFSALGTAALCALAAAPFLAATQALVYGGTAGLICATLFVALAIEVEEGQRRVYGVAALAEYGGDHTVEILREDLKNNMAQLGCATLAEIAAQHRQR